MRGHHNPRLWCNDLPAFNLAMSPVSSMKLNSGASIPTIGQIYNNNNQHFQELTRYAGFGTWPGATTQEREAATPWILSALKVLLMPPSFMAICSSTDWL